MIFLLIIYLVWVGVAVVIKYYEKKDIVRKISEIITQSPGFFIGSGKAAEDYIRSILSPVYNVLKCDACVVAYLNDGDRVITTDIRMGGRAAVLYSTDEIAGDAVSKGAIKVLLGHSRTGNYAAPDNQDVSDCSALYLSLSSRNIQLMEDFFVCRKGFQSIMSTAEFKEKTQNRPGVSA